MPDFGSRATDPAHRERHDGWADVLATMEHDRDESGGTLAHSAHADWTLPAGLGELPSELRLRAESLLGSQHRAIELLEKRMLLTGRHLAALESIPARGASLGNASYLDVTG